MQDIERRMKLIEAAFGRKVVITFGVDRGVIKLLSAQIQEDDDEGGDGDDALDGIDWPMLHSGEIERPAFDKNNLEVFAS